MSEDLSIFKALGERTKSRILRSLVGRERCACELPSLAGTTQPNCSMQLSKLSEWELVKSRRDGRKILYSIKDARVPKLIAIAGGKRR